MKIRLFSPVDADETAAVIARTLRICNSRDYSPEIIEENVHTHSAPDLIRLSQEGHFYVACDGDQIVGCGGIAGYWGSLTESILLTIFVLPEYQGQGIGKQIIATLEQDEYFQRARRVEIPASILACPFYQKMGYSYKNGITTPDEGGCIRLEKWR